MMTAAAKFGPRLMIAAGALLLAGAAQLAGAAGVESGPTCFTAADNARLPFAVIQQAPPPRAVNSAYRFYPFSAVASRQLGALAVGGGRYGRYFSLWANRANTPLRGDAGALLVRKANLQPSLDGRRRQRTGFSSVVRADACTLAQAASVLGRAGIAAEFARHGGIELIDENGQPDSSGQGPTDRCVIPAGTLVPRADGILLDFEVQDGRDPATALAFLTRFAGLVHGAGKKALLLLNPFDSKGQQRFSGITAANAHQIVEAFDQTSLLLWSGNPEHSVPASYAAQMAIITAGGPVDGQRLLINFELAGTTQDDALFAGRMIREHHLAGVMFWRNHADQGGLCETPVNRRIAAIVFGRAETAER